MNGFTDIVSGFSQVEVDALKTKADGLYISSEPSVPLVPTDPIVITFTQPDEEFIIENALFENISGRAIDITGQTDTNQTVIIRDCKFVNMNWGINTYFVDNVIVDGCYFETVGIATKHSKPITFECTYNKFKNFGVMLGDEVNWSANAIQVTVANAMTKLQIENNLLDRSGDTRENIHENVYAEDHINFHSTSMRSGYESSIINNFIVGAEQNCESIGGGGITLDQYCNRHNISDNVIYNAGSFCIGIASSNNVILSGNKGLQTIIHDNTLKNNQHNGDIEGPGRVCGLTFTNWLADPDDPNPTTAVNVSGCRVNAWRDPDDGTWHQWLDVDLNELTFSNNSFTKAMSSGTTTDGQPFMEQAEMEELCFGAGGEGLFETHGQGPEYFDESRTPA